MHDARRVDASRRARLRSHQLGERGADPVEALALGELARRRARHDDDVVAGRDACASAPNASRSRRLTRLRSTAPPTLRDTDRPSRGPSGRRRRRAGTCRATR